MLVGEAKRKCANIGGVLLPIKDAGIYEFLKLHAKYYEMNEMFLGMIVFLFIYNSKKPRYLANFDLRLRC